MLSLSLSHTNAIIMNLTDRQLLEEIRLTQIIILSKLIDVEKRSHGTSRGGGDWTQEAVDLVSGQRREAIRNLESRS
jgi:hypothetical protein